MGENDALVSDQKEVLANGGSIQNSPWKKPVIMPTESPVMGEKVWPALAHVPSAKAADTLNKDSQVTHNLDVPKKTHNDDVNGNSSHKHWQPRYYRGKTKKIQNTGPPFPISVVPGVAYPPPGYFLPPVRGPENFYQSMPVPFPIANNSFPVMGDGQNIHPRARSDQAVNPPKHSDERIHTTEEVGARGGGHMYYWCPPPRPLPFGQKGSITMQESMAPRAYMRPTSVRPAAFIGGPPFHGPGNMHYRPIHPPVFIRAPYPHWITPHFVNPLAPPPEPLRLKEDIVKQIEYYFSDENLLTDRYLISRMDDQGWVPISVIADFKRLKSMCTDIHFILDALQWSSSVEVKGYNLRKSDNTSKTADKSPGNDMKSNLPCEDSMGDNIRSASENGDIDAVTQGMEELMNAAANDEKLPNVMSSSLTA